MLRTSSGHFTVVAMVALLSALQGTVRAGTPLGSAFSYQGQLKQGGVAFTGTADLTFELYDAATDGTQIGTTQTAANVNVVNGLFTVNLDFGAGSRSGVP